MSVTVSVIIPTFNRAQLLLQAIESVLQQTYRDFEIIVIDDGSTDDTAHCVGRFGSAVRYTRQENRGVNAARNRGLSMSSGRYLALLDDDDLWLPWKLGEQVRVLDGHPDAAFVFSDFFILRNDLGRQARGLHTWHTPVPDWSSLFTRRYRESMPEHVNAPSRWFDVYVGDIYEGSLLAPYVLPSTSLIRRDRVDPDIVLDEHDSTCGDWAYFARLSRRHGAVFMDVETTLNRSHEDAVRLTRLPRRLQLERRLAMTRRVWKADSEFYRTHEGAVHDVERRLMLQLALTHALDGSSDAARRLLQDRRRVPGGDPIRDRMIEYTLLVPAGPLLLRLARTMRRARKIRR